MRLILAKVFCKTFSKNCEGNYLQSNSTTTFHLLVYTKIKNITTISVKQLINTINYLLFFHVNYPRLLLPLCQPLPFQGRISSALNLFTSNCLPIIFTCCPICASCTGPRQSAFEISINHLFL